MSMMNIFLSGTQKKNRGHLANIARIARSNGKINRDELRLLKKIQKDLNISELAFKKIIRKPEAFPMNPPSNYEERIERLYSLVHMILVDKESFDLSAKLLKKLAIGIGFPIQTHEEVVNVAIEMAQKNIDFDVFSQEIKRTNAIKKD